MSTSCSGELKTIIELHGTLSSGPTARTLLCRSLNERERGQHFDNARHRAQNGENTGVALALALRLREESSRSERWSRKDTSITTLNQFISAMGRCFNAWHRSSNSVSARKTITTAPPQVCATFNRRPGKAAVVQRSRFLHWPSGPKRPRTCV